MKDFLDQIIEFVCQLYEIDSKALRQGETYNYTHTKARRSIVYIFEQSQGEMRFDEMAKELGYKGDRTTIHSIRYRNRDDLLAGEPEAHIIRDLRAWQAYNRNSKIFKEYQDLRNKINELESQINEIQQNLKQTRRALLPYLHHKLKNDD